LDLCRPLFVRVSDAVDRILLQIGLQEDFFDPYFNDSSVLARVSGGAEGGGDKGRILDPCDPIWVCNSSAGEGGRMGLSDVALECDTFGDVTLPVRTGLLS